MAKFNIIKPIKIVGIYKSSFSLYGKLDLEIKINLDSTFEYKRPSSLKFFMIIVAKEFGIMLGFPTASEHFGKRLLEEAMQKRRTFPAILSEDPA